MALSAVTARAGVDDMAAAANNLLAALDDAQRGKAVYELKADERLNWHFIPKPRNGLPLKEMTSGQRPLAHALLASGMSAQGQAKALSIMSLEQILHDVENRSPKRDPELYYFTIFGKPAADGTWGWRVEGHHLSVNYTFVKGQVAGTPSFFGTNPAEVREGQRKGLRLLGAEEDVARQLVKSLNADQKKAAIYDTKAPKDIITAAERKVKALQPAGLAFARMSPAQKDLTMEVIKLYVGRNRAEMAEKDMDKIRKAGVDKISFAWAGGLERGEGHYYRIQGPTFLLEYDNTQNNANHVHAVWRDFESDFGEDLLRKHYDQSHAK
ncbi:MAG: DUF3500 domain-containing protein [Verrucomicrobiota bacterium]